MILALLWGATFAQAAPALAQASAMPAGRPPVSPIAGGLYQGYTYEECSQIDAESLRQEINDLTRAVLDEGVAGIDIAAIVDRQWREMNMDAVVDAAINDAVDRLREEEDYWSRFLSGWSVEKAREFAIAVAAEAFGSSQFQDASRALSTAVAAELTDEITAMSARSASTALLCMQTYVGERYSETLFALFEEEISAGVSGVDLTVEGGLDLSALGAHEAALTGMSVIIVTQIVRRIARKLSRDVGERIAGRVAGRVLGRLGSSIIPLAGWIIGAGFIIWDLWEGSNGALPQIERTLESEEVKAAIRAEFSDAIAESLREETDDIATEISADLVDEWRNFCDRHPYLCSLPERNDTFKSLLDVTPLDGLDQLSALVDVYMQTVGENALGAALDSGAFERLLNDPPAAFEIFKATGSPEEAQAWVELSGDAVDQVAALKLYDLTSPEKMTADRLARLLALEDPQAIATLVQLEPEEMDALLDARPVDVAVTAAALSPDDLRWLLGYAERSDGYTLPQMLRDLAAGEVTLEALQNPPPTPTATPSPTFTPIPGPTVASAGDDAAVAAPSESSADRGMNPFVISVLALLALLILIGLGVFLARAFQRRRET
jgi:hypothetical protein